jgi:hypothetical protein
MLAFLALCNPSCVRRKKMPLPKVFNYMLVIGLYVIIVTHPTMARNSQNLHGAAAIKFLQAEGTYEQLILGTAIPENNKSLSPRVLSFLSTDKIIANDGGINDSFGFSVDISGSTIIVGAANADIDGNSNQGAAYIFAESSGIWSQQAKLLADDGEFEYWFGHSVAAWGDTVVIGAPRTNEGSNFEQGAVYIFTQQGGIWTQQARLTASDGKTDDWFGFSVAIINEDTVVVGAVQNIFDPGAAYVFTRSGDIWAQQAKLTASDGHNGAFFGASVAIDDNAAIVGAPGFQVGNNAEQGAAYVFTRSGKTWSQQAKLMADDGTAGDWFGRSIDIDKNIIVVGQPRGITHTEDYGAAYIFSESGSNWVQQAKLNPREGKIGDGFGFSARVLGNKVIVGTYYDISFSDPGIAYVFVQSANNWTQHAKLTAGEVDDRFGFSLVTDGDLMIVGAPQADIGGNNSQGAVYIIDLSSIYLPMIMRQ